MKISKWAWLIIGNAALGLFTCYLYIYLWVLFEMGQSESILSWKASASFLIGIFIFGIWNYFMIRRHSKKYWGQGLFTYVGTILLFVLLFQFI
ncbi:hypothetical protein [Salinibacillus xinjiangensis]|uniref:hypothetical protein n=1 Tax=Salinibacillus xinjiangensis TaxID=1229268 RepID=UPI00129A4DD3|nr:hypothetical protein [Salinibacillus xinjiangensis]